MRELRVFTLQFDPVTGMFDDSPVRGWLAHRELLRVEPHFFEHGGRPYLSLVVEARPLNGAGDSTATATIPSAEPVPDVKRERDREAFRRLLSELDESERVRSALSQASAAQPDTPVGAAWLKSQSA